MERIGRGVCTIKGIPRFMLGLIIGTIHASSDACPPYLLKQTSGDTGMSPTGELSGKFISEASSLSYPLLFVSFVIHDCT